MLSHRTARQNADQKIQTGMEEDNNIRNPGPPHRQATETTAILLSQQTQQKKSCVRYSQ
jgi:hypothetical protein